MTNTLIAMAFPPKTVSNKKINGREIYPHSFSYLIGSQSIIGKLSIAEIKPIAKINCLIRSLMRYPLETIMNPTIIHKAKKIKRPISPKATLA